jgi:hypothetical protein
MSQTAIGGKQLRLSAKEDEMNQRSGNKKTDFLCLSSGSS